MEWIDLFGDLNKLISVVFYQELKNSQIQGYWNNLSEKCWWHWDSVSERQESS